MTRNWNWPMLVTVAMLAAGAPFGVSYAQSVNQEARFYQKHMETHPSRGEVKTVEGTEAVLMTTDEGAFVSVSTRDLIPGNAYTMWFVAINNPAACETSPCKGPDVVKRTALTDSDVSYADGLVARGDGTGRFAAYVPVGEMRRAWFGNGYKNAQGAEIHLVINHHGPLLPGMMDTMLGSYRGGCASEGLPEGFPETALTDGQPGPNACRFVQDVIFIQDGSSIN